MDRVFLGLIVAAIILTGVLAGGVGLMDMFMGTNPQSAYVPKPGDCVVLPQGQDAVYDLFYAKEVNPANCSSYLTQEQAQLLQAQANALEAETRRANQAQSLTLYAFLLVLVILVLLGLAMLLRGGARA